LLFSKLLYHINEDIIATLSQYLIRQRRIFAILCNSDAATLARYCNSMRRFRDISGYITCGSTLSSHRLITIGACNLLYYDVYGYTLDRRNVTHYYKNINYFFTIYKYKNSNFTSIRYYYNNIRLYDINMNYDMNIINHYFSQNVKYIWTNTHYIEYTFNICGYFITIRENDIIIFNGINKYSILNKKKIDLEVYFYSQQ
jgi:hypothetical protein